NASFTVVPGLLEGPSNYGPRASIGGRDALYQVIGLEGAGDDGLPHPDLSTLELVVHELAHSYVNAIFGRHHAELEPALARVFPLVASKMEEQAYGIWETVANESGVRAITILFIRDHHPERAAGLVEDERYNAFYWEGELADLLARYRGRFEAAMPDVAALFQGVATRDAGGVPHLPVPGPNYRYGERA